MRGLMSLSSGRVSLTEGTVTGTTWPAVGTRARGERLAEISLFEQDDHWDANLPFAGGMGFESENPVGVASDDKPEDEIAAGDGGISNGSEPEETRSRSAKYGKLMLNGSMPRLTGLDVWQCGEQRTEAKEARETQPHCPRRRQHLSPCLEPQPAWKRVRAGVHAGRFRKTSHGDLIG